jgi:hypothetical protein
MYVTAAKKGSFLTETSILKRFACCRCCFAHRELAQIGISSGLISEADGNAIKELLRKGPVSVALNWTDVLPKANKVNSVDGC